MSAPAATAPSTWARYHQAAQRTADWACALVDAGVPPVSLALYKSLAGLDLMGRTRHARMVLRVVEQHLHRDGDFHAATDDPTPAAGRTYRNAWLAWGALRLGADGLATQALDRLESAMHSQLGAVADRDDQPPERRLYDLGSNCSALNALLAAGRLDSALRVGGFVRDLVLGHDETAARLLLSVDARGQRFDPAAAGLARDVDTLLFEVGTERQTYWPLGFALRGLAMLADASGDDRWLVPARRIGLWLRRCHDDHVLQLSSAKLAWGAARMAAATGERAWAELSIKALDHVLATQGEDGVWVRRPMFACAAQQPLPVSMDTSIERMLYLAEVPAVLAGAGFGAPVSASA